MRGLSAQGTIPLILLVVSCTADGATDLVAPSSTTTYHRWSEATGCPVRIDVISHIHGAEHCGWEETEFITIGGPLGASIGRERLSESARRFVWNEGGAIPTPAPAHSILRSELPDDAYDTGFRNGEAELWLSDDSDSVLYRVEGDEAQVWVLDRAAGLCM